MRARALASESALTHGEWERRIKIELDMHIERARKRERAKRRRHSHMRGSQSSIFIIYRHFSYFPVHISFIFELRYRYFMLARSFFISLLMSFCLSCSCALLFRKEKKAIHQIYYFWNKFSWWRVYLMRVYVCVCVCMYKCSCYKCGIDSFRFEFKNCDFDWLARGSMGVKTFVRAITHCFVNRSTSNPNTLRNFDGIECVNVLFLPVFNSLLLLLLSFAYHFMAISF